MGSTNILDATGHSAGDGGVIVIDDSNYEQYANPILDSGYSITGYAPKPDDFESGVCSAFPQELLIPEVEWKERYEEIKAKNRLLSTFCKWATAKLGVKWLNQNPTNYCWCYAVVQIVMLLKLLQNDTYRRLAPASVACLIKDFQNVGGWGSEALEFISTDGVADEEHWPQPTAMEAIKQGRKYVESSRDNASLTKIKAWWRIKTLNEKMSCLLRRIPVASGYLRIGHEMASIDPYFSDRGEPGCYDLDSYASKNGEHNAKIMLGRQMVGDDMVAPAVITGMAA